MCGPVPCVLVGYEVRWDACRFLPWQEAPISINKKVKKHETMKELMPLGLQREFTVYEDEDGAYAASEVDGDVVVSAKTIDQDMMWKRMEQINEHCTYVCGYYCILVSGWNTKVCVCLCVQEKENFSVLVNGVNKGGLTAYVAGYPVFVPISQLKRREDGKMWDVHGLQESYMKRRIRIAILEVNPEQRRVVCSEVKAVENDIIRQLEVGHVIHGKIRKIEKFGAFVGIEGTRASALLHISNISGEHVDHPEDIFSQGEYIKAVIIGMNEDYTNISLSTSVLEKERGDMVNDKNLVFSNAEEVASSFRERVLNQST